MEQWCQSYTDQLKNNISRDNYNKIHIFNIRKIQNHDINNITKILKSNNRPFKKYQTGNDRQEFMKYFLNQDKHQQEDVCQDRKYENKLISPWERKRQSKRVIASNFHYSNIKNKFNDKKQFKLRQVKSKQIEMRHCLSRQNRLTIQPKHESQVSKFIIQKSFSYLPNQQKTYNLNFRQNLKLKSFSNQQNKSIPFTQTKRKDKISFRNQKSNQNLSQSIQDFDFLKTGVINGQKIYNLSRQKYRNSELISNDLSVDLTQTKKYNTQKIKKYYTLMKQTDDQKITTYLGKKIIRNHHSQSKNKTYQQKLNFRINRDNRDSLINIKRKLSLKNKSHRKL